MTNDLRSTKDKTRLSGAEYARMIFRAAKTHAAGAQLIMQSDGITGLGLPALPVVVLSALSAELFLKAALVAAGESIPRCHNLFDLLMALSAEARESILIKNFERSGCPPHAALDRLRNEGTAFVDWRYVFEFDELRTSPLPHFEFAVAIHDYLVECYPNWLPEK